jgi:hypothetical protein
MLRLPILKIPRGVLFPDKRHCCLRCHCQNAQRKSTLFALVFNPIVCRLCCKRLPPCSNVSNFSVC